MNTASSTDTERDFSVGGLMVSKHRHNLSYESLRYLMTLNSWFKQGLVPETDCIQMFNEILKRPGNGQSGKKMSINEDDIVVVS